MRLVLAGRSPSATSCHTWSAAALTSPAGGPSNAVVDHYHAAVSLGLDDTEDAAFKRVRDRLFAYDIFPPWIIRYALCPPGPLAEGTTIVQQVMLGPVALEMAVRVIAVWGHQRGRNHEAGFTYATVEGHAECGVASFQITQDEGHGVNILVEARSRPGTRLTHLGRPLARAFQRAITRAALRRLADS